MSESERLDWIFKRRFYTLPSETINSQHFLLEPEWDKKSLEYLLSFLNPDNMQVAMVRMNSRSEFDTTTQIKYKVDKLSEKLIEKLRNLNGTDDKSEIPKPLDFIHEIEEDDRENEWTYDPNDRYQLPEIIFEDEFHSVWFAEEGSGSGEVSFRMKILNGIHIMNSSRNFIITSLLVRTMNEMLSDKFSKYFSSAFTIQLNQYGNAFLLEMHGKHQNVSFLARKCLSTLLNDEINSTYLDYEKEDMMSTVNTVFQETVKQWSTLNPDFNIWDEDFRHVIPGITLNDVQSARKRMNTGCHVESLIYGDISKEDALKLYNDTMQLLPERYGTRSLDCDILTNPTINLPAGSDYHVEAYVEEEDGRAAVFATFQLRLTQPHQRDMAILYLLTSVLEELSFANMKLDRATWISAKWRDIAWTFLFVLGPYDPQIMQSKIEAHIDNVTKVHLPQMNYTQFNKLKAVKIKKYYQKAASLRDHISNNLWPNILEKRAFNEHQILAEETSKIRQQELIDFTKVSKTSVDLR